MATPCSIEGCDGTNIARGWCRPVDENPINNDISNLTLMENGEHVSHHTKGECSDAQRAHLDAIRHLATEWHRSDEGREWHRQHALRQGFGTRVQHANQ